MAHHAVTVEVLGPWSLATSRAFWENFAPAALASQRRDQRLRAVFGVEATGDPLRWK